MPNKFEVWNYFHDGSVTQIEGTFPDINITIEIQYLRDVFSKDGKSIIVNLSGCSFIEYLDWKKEEKFQDLDSISAMRPEILSAEGIEGKAHIICVEGTLDIQYQDVSFELDNGKPITAFDLDKVSEKYWDEWEKKNRANNMKQHSIFRKMCDQIRKLNARFWPKADITLLKLPQRKGDFRA